MSLREIKKERTRQAITDAATQLFAERGYDDVTVADIAACAEVAPRTVHRYFPDKQEMLFAGDDAIRDDLAAALAAVPASTPLQQQLATIMRTMAEQFDGRRVEAVARQRIIEESPDLRARDIAKHAAIEDLLTAHIAARLGVDPSEDVRPRCWAGTGVACFFAGFRVWLAQGGRLVDHVDAAIAQLPPLRS